MAFSFWKSMLGKSGNTEYAEVSCREIFNDAQELELRLLAWQICVNLIANAVGRCEFREYRDGKEVYDAEYFLWNIEPNVNQNSTAFLHKLVTQLYAQNEALIIDGTRRKGRKDLFVADSFNIAKNLATAQKKYSGVMVDDTVFRNDFTEENVLHLTLNHCNIQPVLNGILSKYDVLLEKARKYLEWATSHHWKVHVSQTMAGQEGFTQNFANMLNEQLKPFLNGDGAVLPEFEGYTYSDVRADRVYQSANGETATLRNVAEEIFNFTARSLLVPIVLVNGTVEQTTDANKRFLTNVIDPICDQLQEEINRKRYKFEDWHKGNYIKVDTSAIVHFDMFAEAANVEKLVGSGVFTIDDVLRAAGLPESGDKYGKKRFMTKNLGIIGEPEVKK